MANPLNPLPIEQAICGREHTGADFDDDEGGCRDNLVAGWSTHGKLIGQHVITGTSQTATGEPYRTLSSLPEATGEPPRAGDADSQPL